jgi:GT2 family glycosyltransferase
MTIGIVIIGRNEGERLINCLKSVDSALDIVYVDSGSSDDSVAVARVYGALVVELDMTTPFTAARARNAGRNALGQSKALIQFIDGDCMLQPGWLQAASAALRGDPGLAAVFGRRREIAPETSRYNWMCDIEWAHSPGPARYFGGDVMLRASALDAVDGYPSEMIAGEEPDLAMRLRRAGWSIACIPAEMTLHDAAIVRFGQWWRRATRSGHAYAELASRHRQTFPDYSRRMAGVLLWGAALPCAAIALVLLGLVISSPAMCMAGGLLLALPIAQLARLTFREMRQRGTYDAFTIATFQMLAKPAQALGAARYWNARIRGKRIKIMEYKGKAA